ncbi:hypothetical protein DPQ33_16280 [Oceanidesulfovibrio indonesiensis]|uniref:Zinc finger CHC2-type domain-containing protein n=1 Tax=Oceanidesulfovibrio indonesiensis TaxID=54767 RepID=A0A7M3MAU8_9BACT|nr:hypothetical protein [Oceanidesulfovibrio indonesiensis]TVM15044.1 hypothetical protein DPQ33_16280 [Oceanidesulfovibrio indonesiensis]
MSIALDRLTADDRRIIAESLLTNPRPSKSGELTSHCPFHVEESPGGAFFYSYEKDLAYCHSCGQNADLAGIYNAINGRGVDDSDGCREFVRKHCHDSGGRKPVRQDSRPQHPEGWTPPSIVMPPELWRQKASDFVQHSVERLQQNPEQLAELARCGISAKVAELCRFGWNEKDKWPPVSAWGLPREENERGKEKKIWLPEGLVMPVVRDNQVVKLKIRRPILQTPWGDERKYWEVKGGANGLFHVYGRPTSRIWILVETERDAAMLWAFCHQMGVGAIGAGGAAKRPCDFVTTILRRAKVILNALDYDPAGAVNTYKFWEQEFPNSIRYPAPPSMGKDVGDAYRNGLDVRRWVWEGLPGYAQRLLKQKTRTKQDAEIAPRNQEPEPQENATAPTFEQVLERMEPWPLWRQELSDFYQAFKATDFRIFKARQGGELWMGIAGNDWKTLNADPTRSESLRNLRERLHQRKELDPDLGDNSLDKIINHYFGEYLEVR